MSRQSTLATRRQGLCLLSLDAGGARAISQLRVLHEIMHKVNSSGSVQPEKRPCDVFDMIGGSGTGGFVSILLAVIGLNTGQAIEEFVDLSGRVLEVKRVGAEARTDLLKGYINRLLQKYTFKEDMKLLDPDDRANNCKLVVPISYKNHVDSPCTLRNFDVSNQPALNLTVFQALLTTLATPPLFDLVLHKKDSSIFEYVSGDLTLSNPTRRIVAEAHAAFGSGKLVSCLLSLGCGHPGILSIPKRPDNASWHRFLENLANDSERRAQEVEAQMGLLGLFYRFSVVRGVEESPNKAILESAEILAHTEIYLADGSLEEKMDLCIDTVRKRLDISYLEQLDHSSGGILISPPLPPVTDDFVMREEPWNFMNNALFGTHETGDAGQPKIMVMTGMVGCGKTQLALNFMKVHANRFSLRLFVDASSETSIRTGIVQSVRCLGPEHSQKTFRECLDFLAQPSHNAPRAIVYDNADDPDLDFVPLLPDGNGCQLIITSRNQSLGGLSPSSHLKLDAMSIEESTELLLVHPNNLRISLEQAQEISQLLGCLPIALTQARSFIYQTQCSGGECLELLIQGRDKLLAQPVKYQRDMRYLSTHAAFDASFNKLTLRDQRLLFLLCFFHWANFPLHLIVLAAKYDFSDYEIEYVEHGSDYWAGSELLRGIFCQNREWDIMEFNTWMVSLQNHSIVTITPGVDTRLLQMHPLVHAWLRSCISTEDQPEYQSAAILLLALGAREEHTSLVQYLPSHVIYLKPCWNQLYINDAGAFGRILDDSGLWNDAIILRRRVVSELRNHLNPNPLKLANSIGCLATSYNKQGQLDQGRVLFQEALQISIDALGERHPTTITAFSNLAVNYGELGQLGKARELRENVLRLRKEILGEQHPDTIGASLNLASTYTALEQLNEAMVLGERALLLYGELLGKRHPGTIAASSGLAITYCRMGRLDQAIVIQEEVLRLRKEILGEHHPETLAASHNLAVSYHDIGRLEEARTLREEALRLSENTLGKRHPATIEALANLTISYSNLGDLKLFRMLGERVVQLRKEVLGELHPKTIGAMLNLSITYRDLWQKARALDLIEAAEGLISQMQGDNIELSHRCQFIKLHTEEAFFPRLGSLTKAANFNVKRLLARASGTTTYPSHSMSLINRWSSVT